MKPSASSSRVRLLEVRRQRILAKILRLDHKISNFELRLALLADQPKKQAA